MLSTDNLEREPIELGALLEIICDAVEALAATAAGGFSTSATRRCCRPTRPTGSLAAVDSTASAAGCT